MNDVTLPAASAAPTRESQLTAKEAAGEKSQLLADPAFRDRVLANNTDARDQLRALNQTIVTKGGVSEQTESHIAQLQIDADLPNEVVAQLRENHPVSAAERVTAQRSRDALMKDQAWVQKFYSGDRAAKREMTLLNIVLSAPVKE